MEEIKRRFANEIAAKLSGAPESDAKADMIEELAENLASRYEEMTSGGMGEGEAFARAMEQLGDVDELTAYLRSQEPDGAASQTDAPRMGRDEFFQTMGDISRAAGDVAKEAVGMARDFFRSNDVRSALRQARDYIKGVADGGWSDATVHIHVDDDGTVKSTVSGRAKDFGWPDAGSEGEQGVPSRGVKRLDVETTGDVDVYLDGDPDADIRVEGGASRLDVSVSEGVLKVRPLFTASNQFFTFRGASSTDVSLTIPCRRWESIRVYTANGDVDMGDGLEVGKLTVQTASGDVDCRVSSCDEAALKSASGDVHLEGNAAALRAETASGDIYLKGPMGRVQVSTASGDVELSGSVWKAHAKSMSGDIRLASMTLPEEMELSSKSGDVEARIPDNGPFKVRASSVSGTVDLRPFAQWSWSGDADPAAPVPQYTLASISGDVSLDRC